MNRELPDVPAVFRKGRGTRDQIANIHWIIKKQTNKQTNKQENTRRISTSALSNTPKPLTT